MSLHVGAVAIVVGMRLTREPERRRSSGPALEIELRYAEIGHGPLVLFCHGWPESWYSWRHQLVAVGAAGFRCVAPDMRGYGGSAAPEDVEQYTLFHMVGVTPEAPSVAAVFDGPPPAPIRITRADIEAFYDSYGVADDRLDVVVFAAPQLSLFELQRLGRLLDGRQVHDATTLIAATSPAVRRSTSWPTWPPGSTARRPCRRCGAGAAPEVFCRRDSPGIS